MVHVLAPPAPIEYFELAIIRLCKIQLMQPSNMYFLLLWGDLLNEAREDVIESAHGLPQA